MTFKFSNIQLFHFVYLVMEKFKCFRALVIFFFKSIWAGSVVQRYIRWGLQLDELTVLLCSCTLPSAHNLFIHSPVLFTLFSNCYSCWCRSWGFQYFERVQSLWSLFTSFCLEAESFLMEVYWNGWKVHYFTHPTK